MVPFAGLHFSDFFTTNPTDHHFAHQWPTFCLSVGVHTAVWERAMLRHTHGMPRCSYVLGVDVCEECINRNTKAVLNTSLSGTLAFQIFNGNFDELPKPSSVSSWSLPRGVRPPEVWDMVIFMNSLHHIEALETLTCRICRGLRAGTKPGRLFLNEYIGSHRAMYNKKELDLMNRFLADIGPEKSSVLHLKKFTPDWYVTMRNNDLSESLRSMDIERVINETGFRPVATRHLDGNFLHNCLLRVCPSFPEARDQHHPLIDAYLEEERRLQEAGEIPYITLVGLYDRPDDCICDIAG